jgi:hypothetical protein
VIQTIKSLPLLDNFCWFELIFMLKSVIYPNVFHCSLHISRIIDKPPEEMIAAYTRDASKHLTKALTSLEMITGSRKLDQAFMEKLNNSECAGDIKVPAGQHDT